MRPAVLALLTVSLAIAVGPQPPWPLRAAAAGGKPLSAEQERDARRAVPPGAVIRGRVLTGDSGIPVADSAVSLVPLGRGTAAGAAGAIDMARAQRGITVDGAGRFEVMGVGPGYYRLLASPGATQAQYLTGRFPDPRWDHPAVLAISGEEVVAGIEIRLPRAAVITGRVVDEGGSPLAAIAVSVQPVLPGNRRGALRNPAMLPMLTDDMGTFRLFGLTPGDYLIYARPIVAGHVTMVLGGESITRHSRRYGAAYYAGTSSAANAVRIRVGPGDIYGPIELPLTEARSFTIRGMLVDSTGQPVPNTPVFLRRGAAASAGAEGDYPSARPAVDDGTFEISGLTADDYHVSATRFLGDAREFGWTPVHVGDDIDGLVVRMQRGQTVKGQVLFDGPFPDSLSGLQVRSARAGPVSVEPVTAKPDASGAFLLQHQYGPTLIRSDGLRGWYLKSVLYSGQDVTDRPVEFVEGGSDVQVILTNRAAMVSGVVRTSRGSAVDGAVLLVSDDPAVFHEESTTTRLAQAGGDGFYRIEGLRAGRYLAVAVDRDEASLTSLTREYFELLARHATAIVVHDGQSATLNLTLTDLRQ